MSINGVDPSGSRYGIGAVDPLNRKETKEQRTRQVVVEDDKKSIDEGSPFKVEIAGFSKWGNAEFESAEGVEEKPVIRNDEKDKAEMERIRNKLLKDDKVENDKEKEDEGSWCITEMIPDPEDPDDPSKATRRIVAQGKGKPPAGVM